MSEGWDSTDSERLQNYTFEFWPFTLIPIAFIFVLRNLKDQKALESYYIKNWKEFK